MTQWFIQLNKCKIKVSRSYVLLNAYQGKFERVLCLFTITMLSALQGRSASPNVVRPSLKWLNIWSLLLWCKCRPVRTAIMEGPTGLSTSHFFFVQRLWPEYFTVCVLHSHVMKTSKFRAKWRLHEEVSEPDLVLSDSFTGYPWGLPANRCQGIHYNLAWRLHRLKHMSRSVWDHVHTMCTITDCCVCF